LATDGYGAMSIQAIADEAGVTKPTIYRRWRGKAELAMSALAALQAEDPPALTGSTRDDLIALLRNFEHSLLRPKGMAMFGSLLVEAERNPGLLTLFRNRIVTSRRTMVRDSLENAKRREEIRPDADLDAIVNLLTGAFYARYLTGDGVPPDWAERVVDTLWGGIGAAESKGDAPA
jgi:AcrR family transcriptional regulator